MHHSRTKVVAADAAVVALAEVTFVVVIIDAEVLVGVVIVDIVAVCVCVVFVVCRRGFCCAWC